MKKKSFNRHTLAVKMAKRTGLLKKDCYLAIDVMIDEISNSLINGDETYLHNFGKFKFYVRPPAKSFNIKLEKIISYPPAVKVKFIPSNILNKKIRENLPWKKYMSEGQKNKDWYKDFKNEDLDNK